MIALPSYIDIETWTMFVEQRKAMKKIPFTQLVQKRIVVKLMGFHNEGYDANAILDKAAIMGWRDVFPDDKLRRKESKQGQYIDPALAKILADDKKAAPMPDFVKQARDALKRMG